MKKNLFILFVSFCGLLTSQIGINTKTPDPSASLEVNSDQGTKGLLLPRVTTEQRNAIQNPAPGLQVFNTTTECFETYTASKGWYNPCNSSYTIYPGYNGVGYFFDSETTSCSITQHTISLFNGKLYAWGSNQYGQLGNNSLASSNVPTPVDANGVLAGQDLSKASVSTGAYHNLLLLSNGKVYTWGANSYGQQENYGAILSYSASPVEIYMNGVLSGKTFSKISAGTYYNLVLSSDGKIYSWGDNTSGQLGTGNTTNSNIPVAVNTSGVLNGKTITKISAGTYHNLALDSDGKVYSWGYNYSGELGNNSTTNSNVPVAVNTSGLLNGKVITKISTGTDHSLVLTADNKLYTWGYNGSGQLGNNSTTNSNVPVAVNMDDALLGKTIIKISAGSRHNLVLTSDGKIYTWGRNDNGQLGNNSTTYSNVPVAVDMSGALSGKTVIDIQVRGNSSYAVTSDGNMYAWGDNGNQQLGTQIPATIIKLPTQVYRH